MEQTGRPTSRMGRAALAGKGAAGMTAASDAASRAGRAALAALLALACVLAVSLAVPPTSALAMSTNKATARPNEDGGNGVIGGEDTRLTWEGTVGGSEEVTSITLALPGDASFDGSTTRITVLDGLSRTSISGEATASGASIRVSFDDPIPADSLVRLEITNMRFPTAGGDYQVTGAYTTSAGGTADLDAAPAISIIANTPLQAAVNWLDQQEWVAAWNSVPFLGMFLKPQLLLTSFASLFPGWFVCLGIVLACYPFAIVLGLSFAMLKVSRRKALRVIAICYINILRGTPLFLQIYIMFFGLPMVGINIDNNVLGVIVMAVNSSAYLAEIFRAGIQSIPQGQYEAAASLGMNGFQTMTSIILPQTVRRVIPTVTSDFITSYKDTSLLSSVGVMELMMFSKNLTTTTGNITPYMAAAIYYLIVTLPLIKIVGIIESNIARSERGGGPRPRRRAGDAASQGSSEPERAPASSAGIPRAEAAKGAPATGVLAALSAPFVTHPTVELGGVADGE